MSGGAMHELRSFAFGALAASLLLAGDAVPAERPAPPYVEWVHHEPYSDRERDPWVQATRLAQIEHIAAVNAADFSSYRLREVWPDAAIDRFTDESRRALRDGEAEVFVGPMPLAILHVEESGDGLRAVVHGCVDRPIILQEQFKRAGVEWPTVATFTLELFPDGHRRVVDTTIGPTGSTFVMPTGTEHVADVPLTPEVCRRANIPVGAIVPVPDLYALVQKEPDDVRVAPAGAVAAAP